MNIDDAIADDMLLRASACRPFQVSIGVKPWLTHRPSLLRKLGTALCWGVMVSSTDCTDVSLYVWKEMQQWIKRGNNRID
jgi:hypothetical protein